MILALSGLAAGLVATALSDLWQRLFMALLGEPAPRWGSVGRWVLGFAEGRFVDLSLKSRPARRGEEAAGWAFHYVVGAGYGLAYALGLVLLGLSASLGAAIGFGIVSLVGPMLLMKPATGAGVFGMKAPKAGFGAMKTLSAHLSFGLGLWLAGLALL
ncbi:DUF2938 family protein [Frigidibacter sp. MR17.24]|uniref:DUF2938 family protein n=1 Tax=Frigidibacter sp. MR17.24 TaxID=3127345 RepID=UPI003012BC3D